MMPGLIEFLVASMALTLMPGPDIIFVISQSISQGKKAGILIALGLCTGLIGHISVGALGIGLIVLSSPLVFSIIKYAGAAYLIWLGVQSLLNRRKSIDDEAFKAKEINRLYRRGIVMNLLNPKVTLFFLAFLPQFVNTKNGNISFQIIILGVVFIIQAIIIFSLTAYLSDKLAAFFVKSGKRNIIASYVNALIFFMIGVSILLNDFVHF